MSTKEMTAFLKLHHRLEKSPRPSPATISFYHIVISVLESIRSIAHPQAPFPTLLRLHCVKPQDQLWMIDTKQSHGSFNYHKG